MIAATGTITATDFSQGMDGSRGHGGGWGGGGKLGQEIHCGNNGCVPENHHPCTRPVHTGPGINISVPQTITAILRQKLHTTQRTIRFELLGVRCVDDQRTERKRGERCRALPGC